RFLDTRRSVMQEFALLFRSTRTLDAEELPRRNDAARQWALALREQGTLLHASPLEDSGATIAQNLVDGVRHERMVLSVLVIRASDLGAAVSLLRNHPGLAFGTEIEIRPVKPQAPPR